VCARPTAPARASLPTFRFRLPNTFPRSVSHHLSAGCPAHRGPGTHARRGGGRSFSPHPRVWPLFLAWQRRLAATGYVPDDLFFRGAPVITSRWYRDMAAGGRDPAMWTAWAMKYMDANGLFCLYPNLAERAAFTTSWNEPGEHDAGSMRGRPSSPLVREWAAECEAAPAQPARIEFDGSKITAPPAPLRPRRCNLRGAHFVFDGHIYGLHGGLQARVSRPLEPCASPCCAGMRLLSFLVGLTECDRHRPLETEPPPPLPPVQSGHVSSIPPY
jgi:hypothetical protein